jgi:hypothetical protein
MAFRAATSQALNRHNHQRAEQVAVQQLLTIAVQRRLRQLDSQPWDSLGLVQDLAYKLNGPEHTDGAHHVNHLVSCQPIQLDHIVALKAERLHDAGITLPCRNDKPEGRRQIGAKAA